jgi:hypothetical protein
MVFFQRWRLDLRQVLNVVAEINGGAEPVSGVVGHFDQGVMAWDANQSIIERLELGNDRIVSRQAAQA